MKIIYNQTRYYNYIYTHGDKSLHIEVQKDYNDNPDISVEGVWADRPTSKKEIFSLMHLTRSMPIFNKKIFMDSFGKTLKLFNI